jgi:release factor glutamine methyltransferase
LISISNALRDAKKRLEAHSESAVLDAEWLLEAVTGHKRAYFATYPEKTLTFTQVEQYAIYIQRRAQGEPVAYILGEVGFYDVRLRVTPAVLIPRPETELLIEKAVAWAKAQARPLVACDIGTGSGAIAITVAKHAPNVAMHASDISPEALVIAQSNAQQIGVDIAWHEGNLAQPLITSGVRVNLLLANLPYIASETVPQLKVSKHEPTLALDGGADGLDLIRILMRQIPNICHDGALVLLEIGADQGEAMDALMAQHGAQDASIVQDYAGRDRFARFIYTSAHYRVDTASN